MEDLIAFLNHWWRENKVRKDLAKEYKREAFKELVSLTPKRQVIVIVKPLALQNRHYLTF